MDPMDFWWMSMDCCCWIAFDLDGNVLRSLLILWVCTWILIDADGQCFEGPAWTQLDCSGYTMKCREVHDFQRLPMPSTLVNLLPSCSFRVKCIPSNSKFIQSSPKAPSPSSTFQMCPLCSSPLFCNHFASMPCN